MIGEQNSDRLQASRIGNVKQLGGVEQISLLDSQEEKTEAARRFLQDAIRLYQERYLVSL